MQSLQWCCASVCLRFPCVHPHTCDRQAERKKGMMREKSCSSVSFFPSFLLPSCFLSFTPMHTAYLIEPSSGRALGPPSLSECQRERTKNWRIFLSLFSVCARPYVCLFLPPPVLLSLPLSLFFLSFLPLGRLFERQLKTNLLFQRRYVLCLNGQTKCGVIVSKPIMVCWSHGITNSVPFVLKHRTIHSD